MWELWSAGFLGDLLCFHPCTPALLHAHLSSTSSAIKTSMFWSGPNLPSPLHQPLRRGSSARRIISSTLPFPACFQFSQQTKTIFRKEIIVSGEGKRKESYVQKIKHTDRNKQFLGIRRTSALCATCGECIATKHNNEELEVLCSKYLGPVQLYLSTVNWLDATFLTSAYTDVYRHLEVLGSTPGCPEVGQRVAIRIVFEVGMEGGVNGTYPGKPGNQPHRPARFPHEYPGATQPGIELGSGGRRIVHQPSRKGHLTLVANFSISYHNTFKKFASLTKNSLKKRLKEFFAKLISYNVD
ncbi:hypothetical protein PR048_006301 [Dryococelus australis]|uniref:Uncharacterized protein n=1 Tax=Dryococelus australis TaxID=614101 RepID=A0ABQ9IAN9_9NEOP|nr:hypothetical protein PR048_006301 [Dryococelus australis]